MAIALRGSDGQLAASKATLYTAVAEEMLAGITFTNTDTVARAVNAYLNRTGTSRRLVSARSLAPNETWEWPDTGQTRHILEAGDLVEGDAAVANVVDYIVSVIRRT